MAELTLFVSHHSKYVDIARSFLRSLQALERDQSLDIKVSEDMAGSTDWRLWIEENVRSADIFVLLYPCADMDMSWCNYELGRFYDGKRKVICIKNTDVSEPPPAFQPYQAYTADENGIRKFIDELFVKGIFTDGKPLNANIGKATDDLYLRAQSISRDLAEKFAQARVRDQRYERRIVLSVRYDNSKQFDPKTSTVQGNAEGLSLLGLGSVASVPWSMVRQSISSEVNWPLELEGVLPSITADALPPALPPFFGSGGIYIPVITKAQSVDKVLEEVTLIFVAVNADQLRPLIDWSLPKNMPENFALLVKLLRMMFRARWEILEPRYQEARSLFQVPTPERCAELVRLISADYNRMQLDAAKQGISGLDKFYAIFSEDIEDKIKACGVEWHNLMESLVATPVESSKDLCTRLEGLRNNNAKWLDLSASQFAHMAAKLG